MEPILAALPAFLLVLCRIAGFFLIVPLFSARNVVPNVYRIGVAVLLSWLVVASQSTIPPFPIDATYVMLILRETLIGIALGFVAYLFFVAIQFAGSFIDLQVGFGFANVIDPATETQSPLFGGLKYACAMLLFLSLDAHHFLIRGILESYAQLPLLGESGLWTALASGHVARVFVDLLMKVTIIALQLAAPLVGAMFLIDVALGILTKLAPQFNIFVIGVPLKIGIGFFLTLLLIPGMMTLFQSLFGSLFEAMHGLLVTMQASP